MPGEFSRPFLEKPTGTKASSSVSTQNAASIVIDSRGRQPSDPHHLRFAQPRALGLKVSDEFTVPLCRGHHREIHRYSDEAAWWGKHRLDPLIVASTLWRKTHPLPAKPQRPASDGSAADLQNVANGKDADGHTAIPARPHDETKPIVPPGSQ